MSERSSFRKSRDLSKPERRCCFCFSLNKGISILIVSDILSFIGQLSAYITIINQSLQNSDKTKIFKTEYIFYWLFTGGLMSAFIFLKVYCGSKFLWYNSDKFA